MPNPDATDTHSDLYWPVPHLPTSFERVVLPVDKPQGWTSFDVVSKVRRLTRTRKVGHAGTLDPMATGLLILLLGRATKLQDRFMGYDKRYTGTLRLGATTPSYDAETEPEAQAPWPSVTDDDLDRARQQFLGPIDQVPPMYSAVKVKGERLYKKARRGETVPRPPRRVRVDRFAITGRSGADVHFEVACSKGTYIRSLAHDLGQVLGVGAYLTALRREAIGTYGVEEAWTIPALTDALAPS